MRPSVRTISVLFLIVMLAYYVGAYFFFRVARELWLIQAFFLLVPTLIVIAISGGLVPGTRLFPRLAASLWVRYILMSITVSFGIYFLVPFSNMIFPPPKLYEKFYQALASPHSHYPLSVQLATVSLIPAIAEELLFRGFLLGHLSERLKFRSALLVSSVIFAAAHLNLAYFHFFLGLGLLLGWFWSMQKNLALPILAHFIHNTVSLLTYRYL